MKVTREPEKMEMIILEMQLEMDNHCSWYGRFIIKYSRKYIDICNDECLHGMQLPLQNYIM